MFTMSAEDEPDAAPMEPDTVAAGEIVAAEDDDRGGDGLGGLLQKEHTVDRRNERFDMEQDTVGKPMEPDLTDSNAHDLIGPPA